jgi:hypothetical protein
MSAALLKAIHMIRRFIGRLFLVSGMLLLLIAALFGVEDNF